MERLSKKPHRKQLNLFTPNRFEMSKGEFDLLRRTLDQMFDPHRQGSPITREIAQRRIELMGLAELVRVDRVEGNYVYVQFWRPLTVRGAGIEDQKVTYVVS